MGALDGGLADVSVPTPEVVDTLRQGVTGLIAQETGRGGGRDFRAEDRHDAAQRWLSELERAVLAR